MTSPKYTTSVFLNVPFDSRYKPLLEALIFVVHDCGFVARSALEIADGTQVRIHKIVKIISSSKYGIHDISRTGLSGSYRLPRFNMPLELGIFIGAKEFGGSPHAGKRGLILDRERYRYQRFCSDIAGQDIEAHGDDPAKAIAVVRNWLGTAPEVKGKKILPGGTHIVRRYQRFSEQLPAMCRRLSVQRRELRFADYVELVVGWLRENPGESAARGRH